MARSLATVCAPKSISSVCNSCSIAFRKRVYAMPCYTILCYAMLCYAMLC
ncbi:hypothetical protein T484DRAFT_1649013 [Baffinella frigidus]|nr:hypothetical protein T484DRAFT_1649013 [Cryptophyta sp. CCMP2293]